MSYPPPPGLNSKPSSNSPHPSLPARPPPSAASSTYKPAYASTPAQGGYAGGFQSFAPRQISSPAVHTPPVGFQSYQQPAYSQPAYDASASTYSAPQIRNPFPLPGQDAGAGRYSAAVDPEMEAQIAQWQSAYAGKDTQSARTTTGTGTNANFAPLGKPDASLSSHAVASAVDSDTGVAKVVNGADGKQKTVVRSGGGTQWTDSSLLEWDPSHFRLFVGNLAGEVTDESLLKAFSRWGSVQKARVVRDKRTTKSKGYGFVSFSDGDDFFQAARDMQGKYIGSHPVLLRRSTTEIKAVTPKDHRKGKNNKNKHNNGGGGAKTGAGVQKAGSKTKGGLKVLG